MYPAEPLSPMAPRPRVLGRAWLAGLLAVLLGTLLALRPGGLAAEAFLTPERAFQLTAEADGPGAVRLRWSIAQGYYLYRSKLRFGSQTPGIDLGDPVLPPGETRRDALFGEVEVYRDRLEVRLPLRRAAGGVGPLLLEVRYQGCADAGLCYPPQRQRLELTLPALPVPPVPEPAQATPAGGATGIGEHQGRPAGAVAALLGRGGVRSVDGAEGPVLSVEEAFRFQALAEPGRLWLAWDIAPGTYLYRDRIALALEGADGVTLGPFELPPGELRQGAVLPDGGTGDVAVFQGRLDLAVPLVRTAAGAARVTLVARFQGCAERGICYPPQTRRVALDLPPAPGLVGGAPGVGPETQPPGAAPEPGPVPEQDRIASLLAAGNLWTLVPLFFGFGLLLALTPCVFPMIPILSGIIAGQGAGITTRRAFILSLVYVLAMALTYTVAGVLAGLFGANLQAIFQDPWVLSAFAGVFVVLALSMFGFFELQLPSRVQTGLVEISGRQRGGTLAGVAVMGLLSALIVSPCVAPPLVGALIYIGHTGDALLGGVALFALSLGMGAPLIVIGTSAGRWLPRAGAWMETVKAVFGVALLGVAIVLLERVLPAAAAMGLWGLLLICAGVYLGALSQVPPGGHGWFKLWQGLGVVLLVYGVLMLVGAAAGGKDTLQPLRGLMAGPVGALPGDLPFKRVKTVADLDLELAAAAAAGRPVMLDFYADWCVSCKEMERETFSDPAVRAELARFVILQADVTANDAADQALMQGRFGLPGPPAILFFSPRGGELPGLRLVGFQPPAAFAGHLRRVGA